MSLISRIHPHVLFLIRSPIYICNICGQQKQNEMFRRCEACNFNVCPLCFEMRSSKGYSVSRSSQKASQGCPYEQTNIQQYQAPMVPPMTQSYRHPQPVQQPFIIPNKPPFYYPPYAPKPLPQVESPKISRAPTTRVQVTNSITPSSKISFVQPVAPVQPIQPMQTSYVLF